MMRKLLVCFIALALAATPAWAKTRKKSKTKKAKTAIEQTLAFDPYQGSSNFSFFPIRSQSGRLGSYLVLFDSAEAWDSMIKAYPGTVIVQGVSSKGPSAKGDITSVYGPVDFSKRTYMEWIWGEKESTGYEIRLKKIVKGKPVRCYLETTEPKKNQAVGAAVTTPSYSALAERVPAGADFEIYLNKKKTDFTLLKNPTVLRTGYYETP
jgi:hypothetical protein